MYLIHGVQIHSEHSIYLLIFDIIAAQNPDIENFINHIQSLCQFLGNTKLFVVERLGLLPKTPPLDSFQDFSL